MEGPPVGAHGSNPRVCNKKKHGIGRDIKRAMVGEEARTVAEVAAAFEAAFGRELPFETYGFASARSPPHGKGRCGVQESVTYGSF